MPDTFPITPRGYARLRSELRQIRAVDRAENVKEIEAALEHGDLRENAEYHAAKERQAAIDGRMRYVEHRLAHAQVIDPTSISSDRIGFGATVTVLDLESDEERVYALVGEDETDTEHGRISITSPIARALIGKTSGDDLLVRLPKGEREFEVIKVEYKAIE